MNTLCPVCGYDLGEPAADFNICPSCGTEFGYSDAGRSHAELRAIWLRNGAHWWSEYDPRPENWDPHLQINNLIQPAIEKHVTVVPHNGQMDVMNVSTNFASLISAKGNDAHDPPPIGTPERAQRNTTLAALRGQLAASANSKPPIDFFKATQNPLAA